MRIEIIDPISASGIKILKATFDDPKLDDFSNLSIDCGKKITTFNFQKKVDLEDLVNPEAAEYIKLKFIQEAKEKYVRHCVISLLSTIQKHPLEILKHFLDVPEEYLN